MVARISQLNRFLVAENLVEGSGYTGKVLDDSVSQMDDVIDNLDKKLRSSMYRAETPKDSAQDPTFDTLQEDLLSGSSDDIEDINDK